MSDPIVVTVDGPSGSGKTTLGRRLAQALHIPLVDTGLFYRGVMVAAVRAGLEAAGDAAIVALAASTDLHINVDPAAAERDWHLRVDGVDAAGLVRDPRHAPLLSRVSGLPGVREALLEPQRRLAANGGVAVGRDCGTVVFPQARVKIYLQASERIRLERRANQLRGRGDPTDHHLVHGDVAGRDRADRDRSIAPLRRAPDAHVIDTGSYTIDQMVEAGLRLCREAGLVPIPD